MFYFEIRKITQNFLIQVFFYCIFLFKYLKRMCVVFLLKQSSLFSCFVLDENVTKYDCFESFS